MSCTLAVHNIAFRLKLFVSGHSYTIRDSVKILRSRYGRVNVLTLPFYKGTSGWPAP